MDAAAWEARTQRMHRAMVEAVEEVAAARVGDRVIEERAAAGLCVHCGEPDPDDSHYDAWSDWGDSEGPDGWLCEEG